MSALVLLAWRVIASAADTVPTIVEQLARHDTLIWHAGVGKGQLAAVKMPGNLRAQVPGDALYAACIDIPPEGAVNMLQSLRAYDIAGKPFDTTYCASDWWNPLVATR